MNKKKTVKKVVKKTTPKKTKKKETIISQSDAARIAGVSRAAIGSIKSKGTYNFFVNQGTKKKPKWMVDINSTDWKSYIHERKTTGKLNNKNKPVSKSKKKLGEKESKNKPAVKSKTKSQQKKIKQEKSDNPFTGGVDPSTFIPKNTADLKRFAEISKLKLEIEKQMGLYVDREMLQPVLESIGRTIHAHFVNMPRKLSGRICKKLNRVGLEKAVEKIMSEQIAKGIKEVKAAAIKVIRIK